MRGEEVEEGEEVVPWEEVVEEGVALGEGEAEAVGVLPEALIHGKWGSVLVRINIHANLTAVSSYTQKYKLTSTHYRKIGYITCSISGLPLSFSIVLLDRRSANFL